MDITETLSTRFGLRELRFKWKLETVLVHTSVVIAPVLSKADTGGSQTSQV